MTPHERALRARVAAHTLHSTHDSTQLTQKARDAFLQRFLDQVDPDRVLSERERTRRADHARKAYMLSLSRKSAAKRRGGR